MAQDKDPSPTVYVVDDDPEVLESVRWLLDSVDVPTRTFDDPEAFVEAFAPDRPGCLLLDIRMPGMSGLDVQEWLKRTGIQMPVVFLTAHGDVPHAVRAMKEGAMEFLEKPYNAQELIEVVQHAIETDRQRTQEAAHLETVRSRMEDLTQRERQVARLVVSGYSNKGIARELGLSHKTVEVHRGRVMTKVGASSTAHLVQMVYHAGTDLLEQGA